MRFYIWATILLSIILIGGCSEADLEKFETKLEQGGQTAVAAVQTQGPPLIEAGATEAAEALATLQASQTSAPFLIPAAGYLGLQYKGDYGDGRGMHSGIDIWPSTDPLNGGQRGNPIYAVYKGKLGRTGSGVEICHPKLDAERWPDLPAHLVCTYYGHLTDLPEKFARLGKDTGPNELVEVEQGELLGYMDHTDMASNSGIVHLHFSVVLQKNGYWTDERVLENTLDPFVYLAIDASNYEWLDQFP